jgi:large subunit ribosomal protein L9
VRVVFLQDIPNVAEAGDIKAVKRGYAKNYLLPRNLAVVANAHELNRLEAIKRAAVVYREKQTDVMSELAHKIQGLRVTIVQRAGPVGQLYGSVTVGIVAQGLSGALGIDVDRRSISLEGVIRQTGEFQASIRLGPEMSVNFSVVVIAGNSGRTTSQTGTAGATIETEVEESPPAIAQGISDDAETSAELVEVENPENGEE